MTPPSDAVGAPSEEERAQVLAWIDEAPEHTPGLDLLRQIVTPARLAPVVAENAALRAQVEAVKALADELAQTHGATEAYCAKRIRAALLSPAPDTDQAPGTPTTEGDHHA